MRNSKKQIILSVLILVLCMALCIACGKDDSDSSSSSRHDDTEESIGHELSNDEKTRGENDETDDGEFMQDDSDNIDVTAGEGDGMDDSSDTSNANESSGGNETPASEFEYGITDGKMTIYRYLGNGGNVVIPSVIEGKPVEELGGNTFLEISNVTSVVIPESVTNIEFGAFQDCTGLTSVTLPSGITAINSDTFRGCTNLTSIVIPDSVTRIMSGAFAGCSSLADITIPQSVESISPGAFEDSAWFDQCKSQNTFVIVNNILLAVDDVSGDITIPDGVTTIIECIPSIYYEDTIYVPDSVTQIRTNAFGCMGGKIVYKGTSYDMIRGEEYDIYNFY